MLIERDLPLRIDALVSQAYAAFSPALPSQNQADLLSFLFERLAGQLREQGFTAAEVDAVLSLRPVQLSLVPKQLAAVRAFAALPEAPALASANKRVGNILKKSDDAPLVEVQTSRLVEPAEQALWAALQQVGPQAQAALSAGDLTASLQALAVLKEPVDAFFDAVMVNAEDPALRANRLALLRALHGAMNQVADLSRLAA
jgi:glycyl-tRNA synthetase beta chain